MIIEVLDKNAVIKYEYCKEDGEKYCYISNLEDYKKSIPVLSINNKKNLTKIEFTLHNDIQSIYDFPVLSGFTNLKEIIYPVNMDHPEYGKCTVIDNSEFIFTNCSNLETIRNVHNGKFIIRGNYLYNNSFFNNRNLKTLPDIILSGSTSDCIYSLEFNCFGNTDNISKLNISTINHTGIILKDQVFAYSSLSTVDGIELAENCLSGTGCFWRSKITDISRFSGMNIPDITFVDCDNIKVTSQFSPITLGQLALYSTNAKSDLSIYISEQTLFLDFKCIGTASSDRTYTIYDLSQNVSTSCNKFYNKCFTLITINECNCKYIYNIVNDKNIDNVISLVSDFKLKNIFNENNLKIIFNDEEYTVSQILSPYDKKNCTDIEFYTGYSGTAKLTHDSSNYTRIFNNNNTISNILPNYKFIQIILSNIYLKSKDKLCENSVIIPFQYNDMNYIQNFAPDYNGRQLELFIKYFSKKGNILFDFNNTKTEHIYISNVLSNIDNYIFSNMLRYVKSIKLGSNITSFNKENLDLYNIYLTNYKYYNEYARSRQFLTLETFDASKTSITNFKNETFMNCYNLKNVLLPATLTKISTKLFYNCKSLNTIYIPASVTEIESYAFCTRYYTKYKNSKYYELHVYFKDHESIPTIKNTKGNIKKTFNNILNPKFRGGIYVPKKLFGKWSVAPGWNEIAKLNRIYQI